MYNYFDFIARLPMVITTFYGPQVIDFSNGEMCTFMPCLHVRRMLARPFH